MFCLLKYENVRAIFEVFSAQPKVNPIFRVNFLCSHENIVINTPGMRRVLLMHCPWKGYYHFSYPQTWKLTVDDILLICIAYVAQHVSSVYAIGFNIMLCPVIPIFVDY